MFVGQVPFMRIFTVKRELVTNFSGYFWARCSDRLARPGQHVFFHIPAEPLFTFRRFLLWLNGGGLAKVDADRHNIELFDLATRYDVPLLINDLLEEFRRHFNVREPRPRDINRLYAFQNTSRLQRLNAWLWARVSDGMSMQADSRIDMDPRHFMWDLLCAQLRDYGLNFEYQQFDETFPEFATPRFMWQLGLDMYGLRSARRTAEDYGQGSLCRDFHVHEDGSHCDPTWSNWVWIARVAPFPMWVGFNNMVPGPRREERPPERFAEAAGEASEMGREAIKQEDFATRDGQSVPRHGVGGRDERKRKPRSRRKGSREPRRKSNRQSRRKANEKSRKKKAQTSGFVVGRAILPIFRYASEKVLGL